jgi:spermidine synthase
VVEWNRGPLGPLAGRPLDDPRTQVHVGDVMALVRQSTVRFDAVLLDVDNGPAALTRKANQVIYAHTGVETFKRVLRRGGALAVWSADRAPAFERLLRKVGFTVSSTDVPARGVAGGPMHTVIVGRVG